MGNTIIRVNGKPQTAGSDYTIHLPEGYTIDLAKLEPGDILYVSNPMRICECGAAAVGGSQHSSWCPKHR